MILPMSGPSLPSPLPLPLARLLEGIPILESQGDLAQPITGQTFDSRQAAPGRLFVAYQGVNRDVHDYLGEALARGASACLVERPLAQLRQRYGLPADATLVRVADARRARGLVAGALYGHPSRRLITAGITGTDGKTTTSCLLQALLAASLPAGLVSTVGARIGDAWLDTGLHATTPEPEDLQALLALMAQRGLSHAVVETSSHGLAQHRVAGVAYDLAVLTNLTPEHLDFHQSIEAYREAKGLLFGSLLRHPYKPEQAKTAVVNADDPHALWFAAQAPGPVLTYALGAPADFRLLRRLDAEGALQRYRVASPAGELDLATELPGDYNLANCLAALAGAYALGLSPSACLEPLAAFQGVPGRMEAIREGQPFAALVDFAHTPNALRQALMAGRQRANPDGRVIVVFGCAGLRDVPKRAAMGRAAAELADLTVLTAEDPRTESLNAIIAASAAALDEAGRVQGRDYWREPDRFEAIRRACAIARAGDVLLVCGKGHEQSLCFGEVEYPWDDREALKAALRGEAYGAELPTAIHHPPYPGDPSPKESRP